MFKHFLNLKIKSFFRASALGKSLIIKTVMIFFGVYLLLVMVGLGVFLYTLLKTEFPNVDPVLKVNEYIMYWLFIELLLRYFLQKLPVMNVKPLLMLPIKKSVITHFVLSSSIFSIYNFLALFVCIPFCVVLLFKGYPALHVISWFFGILGIIITTNYINFIINKSDKMLALIVFFIAALYSLSYLEIFPLRQYLGKLFYGLYQYPILVLVPILTAIGAYYVNYNFLCKRIFLDQSLEETTKEAEVSELLWTKKFGDIAPFLQLDLKMIWRNKRTKTQVFISFAMLFYALYFYTMDGVGPTSTVIVFVGIFITGIFMSNFGQFIPAWDSTYYSMMMAQNIPLRKYIASKALLISASIVAMFLFAIPYVYFGWQVLVINFCCALYNLGVNTPLILASGALNKKRIDLDKSAFANMQGAGAVQFLIVLPLFGMPILIFLLFKLVLSFNLAIAVIGLLGIIGISFKNQLLDVITKRYQQNKYEMIAGFKEENS